MRVIVSLHSPMRQNECSSPCLLLCCTSNVNPTGKIPTIQSTRMYVCIADWLFFSCTRASMLQCRASMNVHCHGTCIHALYDVSQMQPCSCVSCCSSVLHESQLHSTSYVRTQCYHARPWKVLHFGNHTSCPVTCSWHHSLT